MKERARGKATNGKNNTVRENYGRPSDDHLESFFMQKLRDGKLQMINAESEAEYVCGECNDSDENKDLSKQKTIKVLEIFKKKLGDAQFDILWKVFREGTEKWKYREIYCEKDFPKYLFLDELDLSYILHYFLTCSIPQLQKRTEIANPELLFFCLLSFACRDMISLGVLQAVEASYDQIIKNMEGIKQNIVIEYHKKAEANSPIEPLEIEDESDNEEKQRQYDKIDPELKKGEIYREIKDIEIVDKDSEDEQKMSKTKKIEKEKVDKKPRGRPKNKKEDKNLQPIGLETLQKILQKLINYIAWAYRYIYAQQLAKVERLKEQI